MKIISANLDVEATWSGVALPPAVLTRIAYYGTLAAALVDGEAEVWVPAAIDPQRVTCSIRVGVPDAPALRWADPAARAANDRRLAQSICALPGARTITSLDEHAFAGAWIAKVPWTAAGRDRLRGSGPPKPDQRTRLERLLARSGALVVEPWCERILDVGVCATVDGETHPPHTLLTDTRGAFVGIDRTEPNLLASERARLDAAVDAARTAIAATGYRGPFAIDAFAYVVNGERRFHPLCEINARYTFGWVARALGAHRLGFSPEIPVGARVLVAPAADGVAAWAT